MRIFWRGLMATTLIVCLLMGYIVKANCGLSVQYLLSNPTGSIALLDLRRIRPVEICWKSYTGKPITVAFIGDSTSLGAGANPGSETWTNGISYAASNGVSYGPNLIKGSPFYIDADADGYVSQAVQENVRIPSPPRLLKTYLKKKNSKNELYNYSGSGWLAGTHVEKKTVFRIASLSPKPEIAFVVLGINNAKNSVSAQADLAEITSQLLANNILPVLVQPNNIGVDRRTGQWSGPGDVYGTPDQWVPMGERWQRLRYEVESVAKKYSVPIIDLGTPDGTLDILKLYDPYHPNGAGYFEIFKKYKFWLEGVGI